MPKLVLSRGLSTDLNSNSLKDGQIIFTEDTHELYIDFIQASDNQLVRVPVQDKNVAQLLQQHIQSLNKVENKSSEEIRDEITYENVINALGFVPSAGGSSTFAAEDITYSNAESGLTAADVQSAIDETVEKIAVNATGIVALNTEIEKKVDKVSGKGLSTNDYTTAEKTKLSGIATGAEVNQNAFSNVMIGSTVIGADSKVDTLHLAGSNVTLTPDVDNDKVTIGITKDNVTAALGYTPPTTDTKATQTNTTTDADYRVILSANANDTTETNTLNKSTNFKANPSTGAFYAKGYDRIDITGQTLDINTLNLSTGSPEIMRYIEKTSTGASNITNIPVASQPFILDVELIRWAGTTDYVTKQTFISVGHKAYEYVRYCASGTWDASWTRRVFTDNNTTYSTGTDSTSGITKLYTSTGTATDGTMTQKAITDLVGNIGTLLDTINRTEV